ncbi:MAG: 2-hydroxyacid dehydrogenase, partial [Clostridia bacterium]|nr:2-hydroxyacid dehydrogenase [Clostridia bacterium]
NREDDILEHSVTARLLSFPNVVVTSHQGFLTAEALDAIARTTLDNAMSVVDKFPIEANLVSIG